MFAKFSSPASWITPLNNFKFYFIALHLLGGPQFGQRNEGFRQDNFQPDMHGHPGSRHDGFNNRGPRDMFDHRGPPPDGFGPRDNFGPRGPPPDGFGSRGPLPDGFGPRGPPPGGFGLRGPPPDGFKPRGPLPEDFDHRGPPGFVPSDNFDPRASHPDFDGPDSFGPRGSSESFNRGLLPDNFGPGSIPPDGFPHRGPPNDDFGPPPFDGFGGPPGDFQPRIRIEFFNRGRGRGLQDFRGRGIRGGTYLIIIIYLMSLNFFRLSDSVQNLTLSDITYFHSNFLAIVYTAPICFVKIYTIILKNSYLICLIQV